MPKGATFHNQTLWGASDAQPSCLWRRSVRVGASRVCVVSSTGRRILHAQYQNFRALIVVLHVRIPHVNDAVRAGKAESPHRSVCLAADHPGAGQSPIAAASLASSTADGPVTL
jgi:hypothetical protein